MELNRFMTNLRASTIAIAIISQVISLEVVFRCDLEWLEYEISTDGHKERAEAGDWLCEDYDGQWTVLTDDAFNNLNQDDNENK